MRQYLTFELEGRRYGVLVEHVNSVLDLQMITPLPHASTIVTGLTNVRGNVVPVFDPRETLRKTKVDDVRVSRKAAPAARPDDARRDGAQTEETAVAVAAAEERDDEEGGIVIFEVENGTLLPFIGLQADKIGKVVNLEDSDLSAVPDFLPENAARFFEGFCFVGETRHSIINLKELASKESLFGGSEGGRRA
jgi:chemotaxis signal transduction protein